MPSGLSDADKETVKRTVPKASNKIHAGAVARLYVAHPDRSRWTYTGLQGAAVLANDTVGNTFWIKLVDISPSNRGVIWDQEIYDNFAYNQDRTFFHSFELEECLAGLSFADEKEAKKFKQKMDDREKNASKATKAQPFGSNAGGGTIPHVNGTKSHSRLGGFGSLLHSHRNPAAPSAPTSQSITPPKPTTTDEPPSRSVTAGLDLEDPAWQSMLDELLQMGITKDQIEQNADFIRAYVEQRQAANDVADAVDTASSRGKAAPPPPPPSAAPPQLSPQHTGTAASIRRGPPPAPPPSRRPVGGRPSSSPPPREDSPPRSVSPSAITQPRFRAPPPLADAGKFAGSDGPPLPTRARAASGTANPGPPPPPRPPKTPMEDDHSIATPFRVPPPFIGERKSSAPPPPPSRGGPVPPAPPTRESTTAAVPPPLPPKTPVGGHSLAPASIPPPPPPPNRNAGPPFSTPDARPTPPAPNFANAALPPPPPPPPPPLPPPLPLSGAPPAPPSSGIGGLSPHAPPPPPMPSASGPPPPPPLVPSNSGPPAPPPPPLVSSAPPLTKATGGRDDLLSSIRASGGKGGGGLRKVQDSEKRDRSAAAVPGAGPRVPAGDGVSAAGAGADAGGGLAGSLKAALEQRKKKVSGSDDEKDDEEEW